MRLEFSTCLISFIICFVAGDPTIDVNILTEDVNATIRGYQHSYGTSFRGIRYAKPPLGDLRFKEAQRNDPSGLIEALAYGHICVQGDGKGTSEDCLVLNVYRPNNATSSSKLPVYVWIHGGGFVDGSGNFGAGIYPNIVNKGNIVMVSINYRLGPFGFFSTRETMAPGNWAVSDWIEALNWVQRYIGFFGGDKDRVTIGGQSSGAEAISTLSLTSQANNLYNQMIIESGSAFGAAVMSYSEKTRNTSEQLSINLECATKESWESGTDFGPILTCLRGLTFEQIVEVDRKLPNHRMKWSIVQDKKYLPERLEYLAIRREGNRNVLIGDVHDEWLGMEMYRVVNELNTTHNTENQLKTDLKNCYEMTYWNNKESVNVAANNKYITNQNYTNNDHIDWEAKRIQLWSEMVFIGPVLRDAGYLRYTKNNVYLYSLDWLSPNALPKITIPKLRGCPHSWEIQYLYDESCSGFTCTTEDNLLREYFSTTWVNFITTGNPTPAGSSMPFKWLPMDSSYRFLSFSPNPKLQLGFHPDSLFWACTAPTIDGYKPPFC